MSYLEIYNERVKGLLASSTSTNDTGHKLKVREHPKDGPYVENLSKHLVMNYRDILSLMEQGNKVNEHLELGDNCVCVSRTIKKLDHPK